MFGRDIMKEHQDKINTLRENIRATQQNIINNAFGSHERILKNMHSGIMNIDLGAEFTTDFANTAEEKYEIEVRMQREAEIAEKRRKQEIYERELRKEQREKERQLRQLEMEKYRIEQAQNQKENEAQRMREQAILQQQVALAKARALEQQQKLEEQRRIETEQRDKLLRAQEDKTEDNRQMIYAEHVKLIDEAMTLSYFELEKHINALGPLVEPIERFQNTLNKGLPTQGEKTLFYIIFKNTLLSTSQKFNFFKKLLNEKGYSPYYYALLSSPLIDLIILDNQNFMALLQLFQETNQLSMAINELKKINNIDWNRLYVNFKTLQGDEKFFADKNCIQVLAIWLDSRALPHDINAVKNHYLNLVNSNKFTRVLEGEERVWTSLIKSNKDAGIEIFEALVNHFASPKKLLQFVEYWANALDNDNDVRTIYSALELHAKNTSIHNYLADIQGIIGLRIQSLLAEKKAILDDKANQKWLKSARPIYHFFKCCSGSKDGYEVYNMLKKNKAGAEQALREEKTDIEERINEKLKKLQENDRFEFRR